MNLDELLQRWREGRFSDAELAELTRELRTVEGRKRLRQDWFLEATLSEALKAADLARTVAIVAPLESVSWTGRLVAWWTGMRSAWRWAAAVAAVGLALLAVRPLVSPRPPARQEARVAQPSLDTAMASLQAAVASAPLEPSRALPAWISPTASLLHAPAFPSAPLGPH